MNYRALREIAKTGDVLLVEGKGLVSVMIRTLTATQISHVALLVWIKDSLWVAEMKEGRGYVLTPASLWVEDQAERVRLYYGRAPASVSGQPEAVRDEALHYRGRRYGYLSLARVWAGQMIPGHRKTRGLVCSTFVARCWAAAGYVFQRIPAPGEYLRVCVSVTRVTP